MSADQVTKINNDLQVVQANIDVFAEILNDVKPGTEKPADIELLEELNLTCKEMQNRITDLLTKVNSDSLTARLLQTNDDLNNLFIKYERRKQGRAKVAPVEEPCLIDFGPPEDAGSPMQGMRLRQDKENEFDHVSSEDEMVLNHKQSDFDEMEAWLKANPTPQRGGTV